MSKFKKYLLLIPTAFIMLLNCMSFTAFAADADEETEFPVFLDPADYTPYDFTDVDTVLSGYSSSFDPSELYYFYCAYFTPEEYDNFINNRESDLTFLFFTFKLDFFNIENDSVYEAQYKNFSYFTFSYDPTKSHFTPFLRTSAGTDLRFDYCKDNGSVTYSSSGYYSKPTTLTRESFTNSRYFVYQFTNLPNLELHENALNPGGSSLNVEISVEPELSLNHRFSYSEASISPGFTLTVTNHSSRPIQYRMNIHTSDAALFYYYSYEWVYSEVNSEPAFVNKATAYHHVPAKSSDSVFFSYQHINFATNVLYYLQVEYGFSLSDSATELFTNGAEGDFSSHPYSDFAVERLNNNFILDFSFLDFPFLYKRPSSSDSLYLPYDSDIDRDRYNSSYNAKENDDGTIDYSGKAPDDFYVWDNNDIIYSSSSGVIGGSSSGSSNDGTFQSFASSFNGFFKFINYLFNYLPTGLKNLFLCGFTGIIVVAFIKKVF